MNPSSLNEQVNEQDPQVWLSGLHPLILPPVPDAAVSGVGLLWWIGGLLVMLGILMAVGIVWLRHGRWVLWQLQWQRLRTGRLDRCAPWRWVIRYYPAARRTRRLAGELCFRPADRAPDDGAVNRMLPRLHRLARCGCGRRRGRSDG